MTTSVDKDTYTLTLSKKAITGILMALTFMAHEDDVYEGQAAKAFAMHAHVSMEFLESIGVEPGNLKQSEFYDTIKGLIEIIAIRRHEFAGEIEQAMKGE